MGFSWYEWYVRIVQYKNGQTERTRAEQNFRTTLYRVVTARSAKRERVNWLLERRLVFVLPSGIIIMMGTTVSFNPAATGKILSLLLATNTAAQKQPLYAR